MKTLAISKIKEKTEFRLRRIESTWSRYDNEYIDYEQAVRMDSRHRNLFDGYLRAFRNMEIITYEEYAEIIKDFNLKANKIMFD